MADDEVTPSTPLADPERILAQGSTSRSGQVTREAPPAQARAAPKLKTAKVLLISDATEASLKKIAPVYAKQMLKGAQVQVVNSWKELAGLLRGYERIQQLVLSFHGTPGSLIIGGEHKGLSQAVGLFTDQKPRIEEINFEACSVAEGAAELVPFAQLFAACRVTAWNLFWIHQTIEIDIPANVDVQTLQNQLAPYRGYLLPGTPTAGELAKTLGKRTLVVEWARQDYDAAPLPPPPAPGALDTRSKTFIPRSAARERRIASDKVAKLVEEYAKSPVMPLEHITIEVSRNQAK